jgi:hypothetical protein
MSKPERTNYLCQDCGYRFISNLKKMDVVCLKCKGLNVDYDKTPEVVSEANIEEEDNSRKIAPARAGYYRSLVEHKQEETKT